MGNELAHCSVDTVNATVTVVFGQVEFWRLLQVIGMTSFKKCSWKFKVFDGPGVAAVRLTHGLVSQSQSVTE